MNVLSPILSKLSPGRVSQGKQFAAYIVVGAANAMICLVTYVVLVACFSASFWVGNLSAFATSLTSGFLLARRFVFVNSDRSIASESWRYVTVVCLQFILGTAILAGLVFSGIPEIPSYLLTLPIVVGLSFTLQKYWTFRIASAGRPSP